MIELIKGMTTANILVCCGVVLLLAWGVFSYIKETILSPWSDDDRCPEYETCDGTLHYMEDVQYNGERVAVWACNHCEVEVLRRARGPDIIRTTDAALSK